MGSLARLARSLGQGLGLLFDLRQTGYSTTRFTQTTKLI